VVSSGRPASASAVAVAAPTFADPAVPAVADDPLVPALRTLVAPVSTNVFDSRLLFASSSAVLGDVADVPRPVPPIDPFTRGSSTQPVTTVLGPLCGCGLLGDCALLAVCALV
jgi:hypothetical protein